MFVSYEWPPLGGGMGIRASDVSMDVITTPCGDHDELIVDGITGYVFDRNIKGNN